MTGSKEIIGLSFSYPIIKILSSDLEFTKENIRFSFILKIRRKHDGKQRNNRIIFLVPDYKNHAM